MDNETILVIEDNDRLRRFMCSSLNKASYEVLEACSGKEAFSILQKEYIDLVLLDLNLGDVSGIEILKTIRRQDETMRVIIVSSITEQDTKLNGFDIGCDDYITKPFYVDELLGRVKRLLLRSQLKTDTGKSRETIITEMFTSGPFSIDLQSLAVYKNGQRIDMRKKLFDLFLFFVRHPDAVLSNEQLFDRAWDARENINENSIYVHIRHLRTLIEDDPAKPEYIQTVRGAGYRYCVR